MPPHSHYPERPRKGYGHNHQKSSDSGVVRESQALSAAAPASDYHDSTVSELRDDLEQAHKYIHSLKRKVEKADAALKQRDQEYRELYSRLEAMQTEAEVLKDEGKRLKKERLQLANMSAALEGENEKLKSENEKLKSENEELKGENDELKDENGELKEENDELAAAKEKLSSQKRKLEKKLDAASSAPEDTDTKSPRKESKKKEDKPSSGGSREGRSRTSAEKSGTSSSAPRRSGSKHRSSTTKSKDVLTEKMERANAKAAAKAQEKNDEIYEEEWGPSAPRPSAPRARKDSSATVTISAPKRMPPPLAIASPRSETASTYSDASRNSRTDSTGYRRPTDVFVEDPYYRTR
ncbi:uncharacterized protein DNG_02977 [Cephalotrichum gorgonifer]|uniref:Uncharacterized protein n=1 Tax=Cephalotrichum gorgonifer TaxID=2041049 RepID=A0AAE8MTZ9_9PEZI|nr:uncharacterized protein DNG_02977 [Cephalotrichum gorgonifer]